MKTAAESRGAAVCSPLCAFQHSLGFAVSLLTQCFPLPYLSASAVFSWWIRLLCRKGYCKSPSLLQLLPFPCMAGWALSLFLQFLENLIHLVGTSTQQNWLLPWISFTSEAAGSPASPLAVLKLFLILLSRYPVQSLAPVPSSDCTQFMISAFKCHIWASSDAHTSLLKICRCLILTFISAVTDSSHPAC